MFSNTNTKGVKRQSSVSKEKQVEEIVSKRKGTEEEDDEGEYEKEEDDAVTRQLCIKRIENGGKNMDKEVIMRRIRQRKRVNKLRAAVGTFLSSPFTTNKDKDKDKGKGNNASSVQQKRWVDDAFAAL
ncbi:hypothetical protein TanjilG_09773 [Lupinus angustifolius]|uniref:Uncharacterized protein n=1 Tax=Lupinus angustifolius TaxID=3871 RepID=A0A4P1QWD6_LUPAN|nr:hypothetical protein TanjilG_09773 [Lupinus angustifolius]